MLVQNLKERIAETTGVPAGQQRLIFRGRVLKDEHVLSEYHVEDGHTLHLVVKQPTVAHPAPGTNSMEARGSNENNSIGGVPRARIGQVSHGVVLGTVNAAEQNEDLVADIGRLVGTVLSSFGIGGSNISTTLVTPPSAPPSAPPIVGTNGEPIVGNRTQMGNLGPQGMVNSNHPVQPFAQLSSFPSSVPFSRHMAIPDSLTTLSEFLRRMEQALPYDGSQPSPSPTQGSSRPDIPSLNSRGLPTPDMLGSVIQRVRQLLSTNLAMTLARLAERLEREWSSSDLGVRSQIQNEAGHLGVAVQHVGAMLLELGRAMMMLRMGQSPAESFVNAGPAVFISPTGPNPIMVQPFPNQSSSFFGIPPNGNGVSSPLGSVDPSRNINIHIHAGTSVAPGISSSGARASSGEPVHGESPSLQQTSTNANGLRDSTPRGLPARTIVAAIPARPAAEASGHVLSIIYPVQVRSQQLSVPGHPGSTETSHSNVNNGTEPSMPNPVVQPSSMSDVVPSIVAQINANIAAALSNSAQAHVSSNSSMQSADSRDPNTGPQPQIVHLTTAPSSGHDHNHSSSSDQSGSDASGFRAFGQAPLGSMSSGLGVETLISQAQSRDNNEASESGCDHATLQVDDMLGSEQSELFQVHDGTDPRNLGLDSLSSCSLVGALPSSSSSSQSVVKSTDKNPDSVGVPHPSCSSHNNDMSEGGRPLPLGLGLGGLQPKRRSKPAKPRVMEDASRDMASANQNQGSIATGQQGMQSLVSEGSSTSRENAAGSLFPMAPYISQIMNNLPLGEQGANGQVDMGSMMSSILQSPAFNRLLTGVAEQTGVGSTADLRNMLEQCTQTPAVRNALNQIIEQVDGQSSDAGGLLSGLRRNQGGINLASMMQQMMPVVSQALGRGLTRSPVSSGIESETATEQADGTSGDDLADTNFQADLHQVVETIEQSDSPADIFRSVLESAARLNGLEDHDLVEELGNDVELANEFVEMLKDLLRESNSRV
ncbi:ubiquitin-like domain-containing protein CIP73 isoform X3 [Dioscorea cayenensis subsp. rotundata]|nr:ubiquitin-like domain-containing protein CIP73 isoform X3 [Dioscorea cayenensis subsp. rotundata]